MGRMRNVLLSILAPSLLSLLSFSLFLFPLSASLCASDLHVTRQLGTLCAPPLSVLSHVLFSFFFLLLSFILVVAVVKKVLVIIVVVASAGFKLFSPFTLELV